MATNLWRASDAQVWTSGPPSTQTATHRCRDCEQDAEQDEQLCWDCEWGEPVVNDEQEGESI